MYYKLTAFVNTYFKKFFDNVDSVKFYLTFLKYLCIINIGNDKSTNVVLPDKLSKLTSTLQRTDVSFYYLCSCLSTQFLYRTAVKATFNVKDNINDITKNSITLTINITTFPTMFRKDWWQNHICLFSFPMWTSIARNLK